MWIIYNRTKKWKQTLRKDERFSDLQNQLLKLADPTEVEPAPIDREQLLFKGIYLKICLKEITGKPFYQCHPSHIRP